MLALLGALPLHAAAYSVTARATDASGEGIAYATYRIYAAGADKPAVSNTSGPDGDIAQTIERAGSYRMTLSYVGMRDTTLTFEVNSRQPEARLGTIAMTESAEMLQGVTVTAQRPLVVKEIDRIDYDVQADPASKTATVNDILRRVPMVSVQADGTVLVNGSSNFRIYKNGRPNNSLSRNAKDIFSAMPASTIKKIEVITEPGAEYDAEGTSAILNIVTADNTIVKGVTGSASLQARTTMDFPVPNLWISSQLDKVTVSAYGGVSYLQGKQMKVRENSETYFPESGVTRRNSQYSDNRGCFGYFGMEASYEMDSLNLFTAEVSGYSYGINPRGLTGTTISTGPDGAPAGGLNYTRDSRSNAYLDMNASVNYQRLLPHKGETLTLSYLLSTTDQHSDNTTTYTDMRGTEQQPYSAIDANYKLRFIEHTFQADWTRPVDVLNLNAGAKWIIRRNHSTNDQEYTGWQDTHTDFRHVTNIAAIYAQCGIRLGRTNLRAGLRYEYSHLKASYPDGSQAPFSANLNDLVPSAAFSWQMSDASSLSATCAASISRPGITYLNPAVTVAPGSVSGGNPDLESSRRQSVKLQYMLIGRKINFNVSADYAFVNNGIAEVRSVTDGNVVNTTYANTGHQRELNLNTFVQWSVTPKTRFMLNGGATYVHNSQSGLTLSRWLPNVYAQLSQQLPWKLTAEAALWYGGGAVNSVYGYTRCRLSQNSFHYISLQRSFLKEDRLSVRVSVMQPFGSRYRTSEQLTVNGSYRGRTETINRNGLQLALNISYRFGSLNAQVKRTASTISNDDLVGRRSGGEGTAAGGARGMN